jgi:hypothetical protein
MSSSQRPVLLKLFLPILLIFVFVSLLTVVFGNRLNSMNINSSLLLSGNLLLFLVTGISFILYRKALFAANTQAFLRNVYSGMLLKLFLCMIAAFIYISAAGKDVNRTGLFILMFLYLLYTFLEVAILLKISRQIKQHKDA